MQSSCSDDISRTVRSEGGEIKKSNSVGNVEDFSKALKMSGMKCAGGVMSAR